MIILVIRTDKPEAEIGLFDDDKKLAYVKWLAHRELAETIHTKIKSMLDSAGKDWHDIAGIVAYQGPGSFTGLRIGLAVANTLASGLSAPIVGAATDNWLEQGLKNLQNGQNDQQVLPDYGAPPHITPPRH